MSTILAISSFVARDTVGLSAIDFALKRLGHEVISVPTIVLSNHPGHPACAGIATNPELLYDMLEAIESNGWLERVDAILSGYLPSTAHARFAHLAAKRVKQANAAALFLCDPILGDDPGGLYISEDAAKSIRDDLIPHADILTPNRFELAWLTDLPVATPAEAAEAAHSLESHRIVTTSVPVPGADEMSNLLREGNRVFQSMFPKYYGVPHGTGDFFSALFLSRLLTRHNGSDALGFATAATDITLSKPNKERLLCLSENQDAWADAAPFPITTFQYLS